MAYYRYKEVRDELMTMGWLDECGDPIDKGRYGEEMGVDYDGNIHTMAADAIRHYREQRDRLKEALEEYVSIGTGYRPIGAYQYDKARAALEEVGDE